MEYLAHYGVKGMKWGKRKASLTGIGERLGAAGDAVSREVERHQDKNLKDGFEYASREDALNYAKAMAKIDANRAATKMYIAKGKSSVKKAFNALKKMDIKRAKQHGQEAVANFLAAAKTFKNRPHAQGATTYTGIGPRTRVQKYDGGPTINYVEKKRR